MLLFEGDSMVYHLGQKFSTRDHDNDNSRVSCAAYYSGAWWFNNCKHCNLNGLYRHDPSADGVNWGYWKGYDYSLKFTEMKIRPFN